MAKKKLDTKKATYDEWVEIRKSSIGGSDAATVMNENRFASRLSLYAEKTGIAKNKETSVAMAVGTHCEELVAKMFEEETGKKVRNDFFMYEHDAYPYITANIDRRLVGENAGLECKTTSAYTLKDFEDGKIPRNYYWQCLHYMAVLGFEKMYLAVIIGNRSFLWREIERNEDDIKRLICAEVIFWTEYIQKGREPDADGSSASADALKELYPDDDGESVDIDIDELVDKYLCAAEVEKNAKKEKDTAAQQIQQRLGTASIGFGDHSKVTWKSYESKRFDSKRFESDHPELFDDYTITTKSKRFTAKEIMRDV